MAEILRINESAPAPVTPALPHNIEAEAALLGALMIDNRLVEDVQLKLRWTYFEPAWPDLRRTLRMTTRMVAKPYLRPMSRRRGDSGGCGPAISANDRIGAAISRRDLTQQIYECAASLAGAVGRAWSREHWTLGRSHAADADRTREGDFTGLPSRAAARARSSVSRSASCESRPSGRSIRAGTEWRHYRPRRVNSKIGGLHDSID